MNILYLSNVYRPPRIDGRLDHPDLDIMEEVVRDIDFEAATMRNNTNIAIQPSPSHVELSTNSANNDYTSTTAAPAASVSIYSNDKKRVFSSTNFLWFLICSLFPHSL